MAESVGQLDPLDVIAERESELQSAAENGDPVASAILRVYRNNQ